MGINKKKVRFADAKRTKNKGGGNLYCLSLCDPGSHKPQVD